MLSAGLLSIKTVGRGEERFLPGIIFADADAAGYFDVSLQSRPAKDHMAYAHIFNTAISLRMRGSIIPLQNSGRI